RAHLEDYQELSKVGSVTFGGSKGSISGKEELLQEDESWVEAMQEELLQFKLQQVWVLVDLPNGAKVVKALYGLHQAPRA
ncbi:hypothetical protein Tco_0584830, partial [Tanacetum coccineum]